MGAIRELVRIVELLAKLRGELDQRAQTNIVNVRVVDPDTARRIAEAYLLRHRTAPQPLELP